MFLTQQPLYPFGIQPWRRARSTAGSVPGPTPATRELAAGFMKLKLWLAQGERDAYLPCPLAGPLGVICAGRK